MQSNTLNIEISKGIIPAIVYGDINNASNIFLHLNIANGSKDFSKFWRLPEFKKSCVIIVDLPGHGDCNIKSSQFIGYYLKVINNTISKIKTTYQNVTKVYLTGESFGADLAILFIKKYPNGVNGCVSINPPLKLKNPKHIKGQSKADSTFKLSCKYIFTLLTNINTYSIPHGIDQLTSNQTFLRVWSMFSASKKQDTRINLACWKAMYKAKRYLVNHFKNSATPNIYLIDTKTEFYYLKNKKTLDYLLTKVYNNKVYLLDGGDHLLTIDQIWQTKVWEILASLDKQYVT